MASKIEKYVQLLESIVKTTDDKRKILLEHMSGEAIKAICEMVYNILKGIVTITEKERNRWKILKPIFKKLVFKSVSIKEKRKILMDNIKSLRLIIQPVLRYFSTPVDG